MDPFSSPSSGGSTSPPSTEALMEQVKNQLAQAYAEEFLECCVFKDINVEGHIVKPNDFLSREMGFRIVLQTVRGKCFAKCITKPGTSLGGSESSCISRCVDRYIEATGIISRALFSSPR